MNDSSTAEPQCSLLSEDEGQGEGNDPLANFVAARVRTLSDRIDSIESNAGRTADALGEMILTSLGRDHVQSGRCDHTLHCSCHGPPASSPALEEPHPDLMVSVAGSRGPRRT